MSQLSFIHDRHDNLNSGTASQDDTKETQGGPEMIWQLVELIKVS